MNTRQELLALQISNRHCTAAHQAKTSLANSDPSFWHERTIAVVRASVRQQVTECLLDCQRFGGDAVARAFRGVDSDLANLIEKLTTLRETLLDSIKADHASITEALDRVGGAA